MGSIENRKNSMEMENRPSFKLTALQPSQFYISEKKLREINEWFRPEDAEFILLSTASRNWKALLHFYLEELGMEFWSARLFKKLRQ